jgi:hypothetical protein
MVVKFRPACRLRPLPARSASRRGLRVTICPRRLAEQPLRAVKFRARGWPGPGLTGRGQSRAAVTDTVRVRPVGPDGCGPVTATGNSDNKEIRSMSGQCPSELPISG